MQRADRVQQFTAERNLVMATFLMLGKYTTESLKAASPGRTKKIIGMIEKSGGTVSSIYALLGGYDLAFVAEFPGVTEAMKASVTIGKATGIALITHPALPVEEFDKLLGG
jgi:uncharacterized protein with GYD domain